MVTLSIVSAFAIVVWFIVWRVFKAQRPSDEDTRKKIGAKILRDLLMLADVDSTVILPRSYKKRIEGWLDVRRYSNYWVETGDSTGNYRDLARLLYELAHPPIDEVAEIPVLPSSIQLRTNRWLIKHRWAIEGRRPKTLTR